MNILKKEVYTSFLERIFEDLKAIKIDVSSYELDHICYRVNSLERYAEIKQLLEKNHKKIGENMVNERPIVNFLLTEKLTYKEREIEVLEIPAPKASRSYVEGYEHIEFVVPYSLENFISKNSHVSFDHSGMRKENNREVRVKLKSGVAKFHEKSLREILAEEQKES